ncbi:MAG: transposase, partial [Alloprevotella sp.]
TYCLIGIIEHDMLIGRPIVEVTLILGSSLLTMHDVRDLLEPFKRTEEKQDDRQLCFDFQFD